MTLEQTADRSGGRARHPFTTPRRYRVEAASGEYRQRRAAIQEYAGAGYDHVYLHQIAKNEGVEMMKTYLGGDSDELDGFEFLTMAEAGEVGHWAILGKVSESAGEDEIAALVEWALPIQERHLNDVKDGSLQLAGDEDPYEE